MRPLICWILIVLMPSAAFAGGPQTGASQPGTTSQPSSQSIVSQPTTATPAGVLYGNGSVYLDGAPLSNSMPVMTGDVVETKDSSAAQVEMSGSTAKFQSNAIVRFRSAGVALDRGTISMGTGKSLAVYARDFEITPVSSEWTQYEVERSAGLIHIAAIKNDVQIKCGKERATIVREGHQLTRPDAQNCGLADNTDPGARSPLEGPLLSSPIALGAALAVAGGLAGWIFTHSDDVPISPDTPDKP